MYMYIYIYIYMYIYIYISIMFLCIYVYSGWSEEGHGSVGVLLLSLDVRRVACTLALTQAHFFTTLLYRSPLLLVLTTGLLLLSLDVRRVACTLARTGTYADVC